MFLNEKMKTYILSDVLTSNLEIVDPLGDETLILEDGDMTEIIDPDLEDFESIRARLISDPEPDEEWCTPLMKISKLSNSDPSWMDAKEIIDPPSPACHKIGDESRSLAARHIIDRLKENNLLCKIEAQSPRLRSAVELLSKPDADFVYPVVRFMVSQIREKYPGTYTSVVAQVNISIPQDHIPSTMLVSLAKLILENSEGIVEVNWGKFIAILALCGAIAVDSVEQGYPEGITGIVETFGCLVEQFMGDWILSPVSVGGGGGWEMLIKDNSYEPILPPVPRAILIISFMLFMIYLIIPYVLLLWYSIEAFFESFIANTGFKFFNDEGNVSNDIASDSAPRHTPDNDNLNTVVQNEYHTEL